MKLRYFIDWSGDILWAADDDALAKFGYPVNLDDLPLTAETKNMAIQLVAKWTKNNSQQHPKINESEICKISERLYSNIVKELGSDFEILNEMCLLTK